MTANDPIRITVTKKYRHSAERVFDAWLNVETAKRFLFATEGGEMIRAEMETGIGGKFTFVDRRKDGDAAHYGVFLELDRPRRIVFAFSAERHDPQADRITIDIKETPEGCDLTLTHEMAPEWADYKARTQEGWNSLLDGLERELSRLSGA